MRARPDVEGQSTVLAPVAEQRVRVLPGIGGPLAPVTIIGLSLGGAPLVKLEVPLLFIGEARAFLRAYLARRDLEAAGAVSS